MVKNYTNERFMGNIHTSINKYPVFNSVKNSASLRQHSNSLLSFKFMSNDLI